jgi:hypothetical protein
VIAKINTTSDLIHTNEIETRVLLSAKMPHFITSI